MKLLAIVSSFAISTVTFASDGTRYDQASNGQTPSLSLRTPCDAVVESWMKTYDWTSHEDDFNEAKIVSVIAQGRGYPVDTFVYTVRAGYELGSDNSENSTYSVSVKIVEKNVGDFAYSNTQISCVAAGEIKEIRSREM